MGGNQNVLFEEGKTSRVEPIKDQNQEITSREVKKAAIWQDAKRNEHLIKTEISRFSFKRKEVELNS